MTAPLSIRPAPPAVPGRRRTTSDLPEAGAAAVLLRVATTQRQPSVPKPGRRCREKKRISHLLSRQIEIAGNRRGGCESEDLDPRTSLTSSSHPGGINGESRRLTFARV